MNAPVDAIIIGASIGGLASAATLAQKGARVLLFEAGPVLTEPQGPLYALDPVLVRECRLAERGLHFEQRDLPLTGMGVAPITITRDRHDTARMLACVSDSDARAWPEFRREQFAHARALRRWWWSSLKDGAPETILESRAAKRFFARLGLTGADAYLGARFESDALIATLLWDATKDGFAPSEPGSALSLVWRAAQEMAGLQAASSLAESGSLLATLTAAAGKTEMRLQNPVRTILLRDGAAVGVQLEDGETIKARSVISGLSRTATQLLLGMAPAALSPLGEATITLHLNAPHRLAPARYILAERSEIYVDAHEAARAGQLPAELPAECVPVAPDRIVVTVRPLPAKPAADWRSRLAAQVVHALGKHVAGLARSLVGVDIRLSAPRPRATLAHLLAPAGLRIRMPQDRLYLAGADAEPVTAVSGRAGRIAAEYAAAALKT